MPPRTGTEGPPAGPCLPAPSYLRGDPDLRGVWRRMPLRQLCAAGCAALALLMIAVGAPLMEDLGFFAVLAAGCYFAAGWVAHGGPSIAFACVPGADAACHSVI